MKTGTKYLIIFITAGLALLSFVSVRISNDKIIAEEKSMKEQNAFNDIIKIIKNRHSVFNEDLKGKIIVLNIWATWCKPCKKEIPELNKLVKEFASDKVVFLALNRSDSTIEQPIIAKQKIQFDYQQLFAQEVLIKALYSFKLSAEPEAIPLNMVINPEGKIEFYSMGYKPEKIQAIREYLIAAAKSK